VIYTSIEKQVVTRGGSIDFESFSVRTMENYLSKFLEILFKFYLKNEVIIISLKLK